MKSLLDEFEYAGSEVFNDNGVAVTSEYFNCMVVLAI
jgi:hypothetical protein